MSIHKTYGGVGWKANIRHESNLPLICQQPTFMRVLTFTFPKYWPIYLVSCHIFCGHLISQLVFVNQKSSCGFTVHIMLSGIPARWFPHTLSNPSIYLFSFLSQMFSTTLRGRSNNLHNRGYPLWDPRCPRLRAGPKRCRGWRDGHRHYDRRLHRWQADLYLERPSRKHRLWNRSEILGRGRNQSGYDSVCINR